MSDTKFKFILREIEQFNNDLSLQNLDNYLKIVQEPLYKELLKESVDNSSISNPILKKFLDIVFIKISGQAIDKMTKKLQERLSSK